MMKEEKMVPGMLCTMLACSVVVTELLLLIQGRWREAIPLHLCSISAVAAGCFACYEKPFLLDFLWYLGMPGAALALLFPAPASSICQPLFNASYFLTHALILLIPICRMAGGMRPRAERTPQMLLVLLGLSGIAALGNKALGTNFFFLSLPPAGTPLEALFHLGYPLYLLTLFALMLLCCAGMDAAAKRIRRKQAQ